MKALLLNPAVDECGVPHYGLAMLAGVLKLSGHQVRVADYHYSCLTPSIEAILEEFEPEVVGISMFSVTKAATNEIIHFIRQRYADIPIVCGGPHIACYYEDMVEDQRLDYIVIGEAEDSISDIVDRAKRETHPQVIRCQYPDINNLPLPDFTSFYRHEELRIYPLITSRGCPYGCTFCAVRIVNSRKWRHRAVSDCIEELRTAKDILPALKEIVIWDDMFNLVLERGKAVLRSLIESHIGLRLCNANFRADRVDDEMMTLLKEAGVEIVQLGAEHGDPEVFNFTNKGESLEDIRQAARLVKKHGMKLYLSFIVGLPGDNIHRTLKSIRFARSLNADRCLWNILVPYRGTAVYDWFIKKGRVDDSHIAYTLPNGRYNMAPNADAPDFTAEERLIAHRIAQILTENLGLRGNLGFIFLQALKHGLLPDLLALVAQKLVRRLPLNRAGS